MSDVDRKTAIQKYLICQKDDNGRRLKAKQNLDSSTAAEVSEDIIILPTDSG
jgi:hypothetical protein